MTIFSRCAWVAILALVMTSCTSTETVTTVEAVVAAVETISETVPGLSPALRTELTTYTGLASEGVQCVTDELATTDTGLIRGGKIAACFSALNYSALSPAAQVIAGVVNVAIQKLLAFYDPPGKVNTVTVTRTQKDQLAAIHNRAVIAKAKVYRR